MLATTFPTNRIVYSFAEWSQYEFDSAENLTVVICENLLHDSINLCDSCTISEDK